MCVVFFSLHPSPNFQLIIASNRDEFIHRKTKRAAFWPSSDILAAIDKGKLSSSTLKNMALHPNNYGNPNCAPKSLSTGINNDVKNKSDENPGTWIGVTKKGRFSFVTNYRQHPHLLNPNAKSRGLLVSDFLTLAKNTSARDYTTKIQASVDLYNGFNLICGSLEDSSMYYIGNRGGKKGTGMLKKLESGVCYGMSNGVLSDCFDDELEWAKATKGKSKLKEIIQHTSDATEVVEKLLHLLKDDKIEDDENLPKGMYDYKLEKKLSSIFVRPNEAVLEYGTRTHTVFVVDGNGDCFYVEEDLFVVDQDGGIKNGRFRNDFNFKLES